MILGIKPVIFPSASGSDGCDIVSLPFQEKVTIAAMTTARATSVLLLAAALLGLPAQALYEPQAITIPYTNQTKNLVRVTDQFCIGQPASGAWYQSMIRTGEVRNGVILGQVT